MAGNYHWYVPSRIRLRIMRWPEERDAVVYQPASGNVHLVDPVGARILELLSRSPMSAMAILEQLTRSDELDPEIKAGQDLERTYLRQLHQLGLIRIGAV